MSSGQVRLGVLGCVMAMTLPVAIAAQAKSAEPAAAAVADNDAGLDAAAQGAIGKALFLRCLCKGEALSFDANGRLEQGVKSQPVDWTLAAIDVAKAKRTGPERIELDGTRAAIRWNDGNKNFDRKSLKTETVHVVLNGVADAASVRKALAAVFAVGIDRELQASTPPYWQHFFDPSMPWPADGVNAASLFVAGTKVRGVEVPSPAVGKKSIAEFTAEAQHDRVEGPVVLAMIVDSSGAKHRLRIVQPLGYGLDARAVVAAEKTQFVPSVVNGQPATVLFLLKENFSIAQAP